MQTKSRMGRPPHTVAPTEEEFETLRRWARGRAVSAQLVLRARIILLCAEEKGTSEVAGEVGVTPTTVSKWRKRFATDGLDGLSDLPRPRTSRKLSDETVEELIRTTLETTPPGQTHWTTRQL
ncbi:MAG: helix-turn-helix domain-containing protein, partial [Enhygromyxa sp.]